MRFKLAWTDWLVRLFRDWFTDVKDVYRDAKNEFIRNLVKFDQSFHDACFLLTKRTDQTVSTILNNQNGISLPRKSIADFI